MREKGWYLFFDYKDPLRDPRDRIVKERIKLDAETEAEADKKADGEIREIKKQIRQGIGKYAKKVHGDIYGIRNVFIVFMKPKE